MTSLNKLSGCLTKLSECYLLSREDAQVLREGIVKLCLALMPLDPEHPEWGESDGSLGIHHYRALGDAGLMPLWEALRQALKEEE